MPDAERGFTIDHPAAPANGCLFGFSTYLGSNRSEDVDRMYPGTYRPEGSGWDAKIEGHHDTIRTDYYPDGEREPDTQGRRCDCQIDLRRICQDIENKWEDRNQGIREFCDP
jgi:hypothetical protein